MRADEFRERARASLCKVFEDFERVHVLSKSAMKCTGEF